MAPHSSTLAWKIPWTDINTKNLFTLLEIITASKVIILFLSEMSEIEPHETVSVVDFFLSQLLIISYSS